MTDGSSITLTDAGLGTTYERWALNRALLRIQQAYHIQSVLEGPGDGMTGIAGINSIILGRIGVHVAVHLTDAAQATYAESVWRIYAPVASLSIIADPDHRFPNESYELVWNFNILSRASKPASLLAEMARISRRYVFFCIPNADNYSFWLHRLQHRVSKQPWDHGDIGWMRPTRWADLLRDTDLHLRDAFYLDCPWWPDIVDVGQLIADFLPFLRHAAHRASPENRMRWEPATLPYYEPERYPEIHHRLARLAFIENTSSPLLKRLFGHHFGILAEKQ